MAVVQFPAIVVADHVVRNPAHAIVQYLDQHGGTVTHYDFRAATFDQINLDLIRATRSPWMGSRISAKEAAWITDRGTRPGGRHRRGSEAGIPEPVRCTCQVFTVKPECGLRLAQRLERRPDLGREQLGLFPGGEVAAPVDLVEVGDVGVGLLDPAARSLPDLAGERGEADRELDLRTRVS